MNDIDIDLVPLNSKESRIIADSAPEKAAWEASLLRSEYSYTRRPFFQLWGRIEDIYVVAPKSASFSKAPYKLSCTSCKTDFLYFNCGNCNSTELEIALTDDDGTPFIRCIDCHLGPVNWNCPLCGSFNLISNTTSWLSYNAFSSDYNARQKFMELLRGVRYWTDEDLEGMEKISIQDSQDVLLDKDNQCIAKTKNGDRCKNFSVEGRYCYIHKDLDVQPAILGKNEEILETTNIGKAKSNNYSLYIFLITFILAGIYWKYEADKSEKKAVFAANVQEILKGYDEIYTNIRNNKISQLKENLLNINSCKNFSREVCMVSEIVESRNRLVNEALDHLIDSSKDRKSFKKASEVSDLVFKSINMDDNDVANFMIDQSYSFDAVVKNIKKLKKARFKSLPSILRIPTNSATQSNANRPPVPMHSGHPYGSVFQG